MQKPKTPAPSSGTKFSALKNVEPEDGDEFFEESEEKNDGSDKLEELSAGLAAAATTGGIAIAAGSTVVNNNKMDVEEINVDVDTLIENK